jgi:hypothetical protein
MTQLARATRIAVLLHGLLAAGSCTSSQALRAAVVRYEDFGPPAAAYELIGYDFWQWQDEGGSSPDQRYDIRVVVYRNSSPDEVARRYPVQPERQQDYRYVSYDAALKYLDDMIAENALPALTERLRATRRELQTQLADRN